MKISIDDLYDIMFCEKCGIVFNINNVKTIKGKWTSDKCVCPLCKYKNTYINWGDKKKRV